MKKTGINAIHLHLEMKEDYLDEDQRIMMKRYGGSSTGNSISRDILIPSDMPLHNLHYAIQRLFGWQNSHLRAFRLPEKRYEDLTGNMVRGWVELVGVLFQPPDEAGEDLFWDEDYEKGDIRKWLKRKYKGPYKYGGRLEIPEEAQKNVQVFLDHFKNLEVRESFADYMKRTRGKEDKKMKILKKAPIAELTIEEMRDSVFLEFGPGDLLETLITGDILADKNQILNSDVLFPVTDKIIYNYDYGDNWIVEITREDSYVHLVEEGHISPEEITDANEIVLNEHEPVCIHRDGIHVLDDVGGLGGFTNFLYTVYEEDEKDAGRDMLSWAKRLGWRDKIIALRDML